MLRVEEGVWEELERAWRAPRGAEQVSQADADAHKTRLWPALAVLQELLQRRLVAAQHFPLGECWAEADGMSAGKGCLRIHGAADEEQAVLAVLGRAVLAHAAVQTMKQAEVLGGVVLAHAAVETTEQAEVLGFAVLVHAAVRMMAQSEVAAWQDHTARDCLLQPD